MDRRLTITDIKNLSAKDVGALKGAELRQTVADAARIANQRLRRLEKAGYDELSSAYQSAVRHGHERFTTKGKGAAALRNELREIREFLEMKTSTVVGFKATKKDVYKRIGGGFKDVKKEKSFWKSYRTLESLGDVYKAGGSEELQKMLYQTETKEGRQKIIEEINRERAARFNMSPEEAQELASNNMMITEYGELEQIGRGREDKIYLTSQRAAIEYERTEADNTFYRSI